MGRDRDPFDRTIVYLRERLAFWPPLQGAVISINGLAQTLDVSQTPVREALATLAGEGLIVRTPAGYAGATFDPATLAAHFDFAGRLVAQSVRGSRYGAAPVSDDLPTTDAAMAYLAASEGDIVLTQASRRVLAQLSPFLAPAQAVLGDGLRNMDRLHSAWGRADRPAILSVVRDHYARRRRAAGKILAAAIGLGAGR